MPRITLSSLKQPTFHIAAALWIISAAPSASAIEVPQDGLHKLSNVALSELPLDHVRLQNVHGEDLVYYQFTDNAAQERGLRVRDLDGNPVPEYEILVEWEDAILDFVVAETGAVYAKERRNGSIHRIHIYVLDGNGAYTELTSIGPDGPEGGNFSPRFGSHGAMAVSPVTGRLYVDDQIDAQNDLEVSGNIRVFAPNGAYLTAFNTNGILAPTLEGGIASIDVAPGPDGTGELWVKGASNWNGNGFYDGASAWFKVFSEAFTEELPTEETFPLLRLFDNGGYQVTVIQDDLMFASRISNRTPLLIVPLSADAIQSVGTTHVSFGGNFSVYPGFLGRDQIGRYITRSGNSVDIWEPQAFRTLDPRRRNAAPNPIVSMIEQRSGTTVVDIDFRVEDSDDSAVEVVALALPNGEASVLSAIPMVTFVDGTESNVGEDIATNTQHRLSWNAAEDWNVDFGDVSVMILARDSRTHFFDVHLVEIPTDGARQGVTISRNPLKEEDFTMQWLWLIGQGDPSIALTNGLIFGVDAPYQGVQFTDPTGKSTDEGRNFLLGRDALRLATETEVVRAREGATPGHIVSLAPPRVIAKADANLPLAINEYGIEATNGVPFRGDINYGPNSDERWHVVLIHP